MREARPRTLASAVTIVAFAAFASACSASSGGDEPAPAGDGLDYSNGELWLCGPDAKVDRCKDDVTATDWRADGTFAKEERVIAASPAIDCFYVYPTVDLSFAPGLHDDLSDVEPMLDPLLSQAARLEASCRVVAPLYRQVTIGTFSAPSDVSDPLLEHAYGDVEAAFDYWLAHAGQGRPFVLAGHSQGSQLLRRLIQRRIETDDALLARMRLALLLGGDVTVLPGQTKGGSFTRVPLCTKPDEAGCVVAYRSFSKEYPPADGSRFATAPAGLEMACTNPVDPTSDLALLAGTYLPTSARNALFFPSTTFPKEITTPFAALHGFYSSSCRTDQGRRWLEISTTPGAGDQRKNVIPFDSPLLAPSFLGTHVLDYNWAMQDLADWVGKVASP